MSVSYQAVQSAHSAIQFQHEHNYVANKWYHESNVLIQLSAKNEDALKHLILKLEKNQIKHSVFREPDLNNEITAIAIEPSDKARKFVSSLPLMLKEYRNSNEKSFRKEKCYV